MQSLDFYLKACVEMGGSDLHFKTDTGKTYVRVLGDLQTRDEWPTFTPEEFQTALFSLLRPVQVKKFEHDLELDFAYELPGVSRFRGNVYQQRGNLQAAFRAIPYVIQSMEELELPAACYDFIQRPRGFVLVTGPAGSGKSTTLAAMIDRLNRTDAVHIMTVEDPVEFVHGDHVALINQRELETDTNSFANALKHVLRQDPDVILVGEMRDLETVHLAITAAETGHLVFATLHTIDAVQTVDRVVDVFPMHQQQQIRMQMAVNLLGVVSQTLVKRADGKGRAAAFEVLVATPAIRNMIRENKTYQMNSMIQTGSRAKMQTLDQALVTLVKSGLVTRAEAYSKAKDPYEFERLLNVEGGSGGQPPAAAPPSSAPPSAASAAEAGRPPLATPTAGAVPPAATGPAPVRGQPNRPTFRRD